ncbi:hypothetical protein NQD34_007873 [Periophthalmus magnuspinnatus]|nr:hypothetical protein NQD34_007873 [Periophthalmus magnuspinnatus]
MLSPRVPASTLISRSPYVLPFPAVVLLCVSLAHALGPLFSPLSLPLPFLVCLWFIYQALISSTPAINLEQVHSTNVLLYLAKRVGARPKVNQSKHATKKTTTKEKTCKLHTIPNINTQNN